MVFQNKVIRVVLMMTILVLFTIIVQLKSLLKLLDYLERKKIRKNTKILLKKIKNAILEEYFTATGRLSCDTQTAYIIAFAFDVYNNKEKLLNQFIDKLGRDAYDMKSGFVGAPLFCTTLAKVGRADLAFKFLLKESFPSWLYSVNLGATTIWERWNSILEDGSISGTGMNSLNHYSYGSVVQFMYEYVGGIRPATPGFKTAIIAPEPNMKLRYFNSNITTASGKYVSNWKIAEDGVLTLNFSIPFNGKAEVTLPRFNRSKLTATGLDAGEITDDGTITLITGDYEISYMPSVDYRYIYSPDTRLMELADDKEVMELLEKELPIAYGIIVGGDKEAGSNTLGALPYLNFYGFVPDMVYPVIEKIYNMNRW